MEFSESEKFLGKLLEKRGKKLLLPSLLKKGKELLEKTPPNLEKSILCFEAALENSPNDPEAKRLLDQTCELKNKQTQKERELFFKDIMSRLSKKITEPLQWLSNPQPIMAGTLGGEQKRFLFEKFQLKNEIYLGLSLDYSTLAKKNAVLVTLKFIREDQFVKPSKVLKEIGMGHIYLREKQVDIDWQEDKGELLLPGHSDAILLYTFKDETFSLGFKVEKGSP